MLLGLAALSTVAIATYSASDPLLRMVPVENAAGAVGATLAGALVGSLGVGALSCVAAMAWIGGGLAAGKGLPRLASRFWVGAVSLTLALATLPPTLHEVLPGTVPAIAGGWLGDSLIRYERVLLGLWGGLVVNTSLFVIGGLSLAGVSSASAFWALGAGLGAALAGIRNALAASVRALRAGARLAVGGVLAGVSQIRAGAVSARIWRERRARRARVAQVREPDPVAQSVEPELPSQPVRQAAAATPAPKVAAGAAGEGPAIVDHDAERESLSSPSQETFRFEESGPSGPFELPDMDLFQLPPDTSIRFDRDSLLMNSRILEKKLSDFGVRGKVVRVHPGPVITMYEYEPAAGMKVSKIVNLSDDLAMALRALSIRIIAPLPGKSVVGIEVPNVERETVYLRSLLESESFRASKSPLTLAMGKDIFGNCVEADLAKMPHLLVAGATGTGKSVFLNSLLCAILSRSTPDQCRLLLIDPKLLELSIYEGIPHLIADVVTQPKRAAAALAGVVRKMEERYMMMSALQVRNIDQFNRKVDEALADGEKSFRLKALPGEEEGVEVAYQRLAYIVVVIDELADLMVQVARDVEEALQRLAQMSRAAGIHLILATQRPSVDVLTGVIKANFPARVSFQVSSRTDSRTVLDQNGADHLLGQGDMLFLPPGTSHLQRLHGAFVSEKEVSDLVAFLREQGAPEFDEGLIRVSEEGESGGVDEDVDELFDQAVAIVAETRNASISYIQRRLKVGYNRAARIVEQMEGQAMVGPQDGTRPREVFLRAPDAEDAGLH